MNFSSSKVIAQLYGTIVHTCFVGYSISPLFIIVGNTVYMLLLHSLTHILSQSASTSTICLAVLNDKKKFSDISGSITTTSELTTDEVDSKEPVIVITDDEDEEKEMSQSSKSSSGQGQKMDTSQNETSSVEIGSQVASVQMSDNAVTVPSASAGGDGSSSEPSPQQFTLSMLSTALQNVNQSLGIVPGNDKQQEEATTGHSQTDTDNSVDVPPGEKRPRLDTHEVTTLQQSTLPQDIHDKLHSNIR